MDRAEALKTAVEHVKALTTNERGYRRDGMTLADQAAAVATFAEFLVGGADDPALSVLRDPAVAALRNKITLTDDGDGYLRPDMP